MILKIVLRQEKIKVKRKGEKEASGRQWQETKLWIMAVKESDNKYLIPIEIIIMHQIFKVI